MQFERENSSDDGPFALAIDLGGTWVRAALVTRAGLIAWRGRVPTGSQDPGDVIVGRVNDLIAEALSGEAAEQIAGIGIAVASPVDPETGIMYAPPNLMNLDGISFKKIWSDKGRWPVFTGNDATLAALGEYTYGAGKGSKTLIYITQSTGIGGGIVADGRLIEGAYGMAGEIGHMCIDTSGPLCKCGHRGCLESYASGTAIAESARSLAQIRNDSVLSGMVDGDLGNLTSEHVFQAAGRGDQASRDLLDRVSQAMGVGLVNVLHLFNPDTIVMGGGVSQNWDYLRPMVEEYLQANAMEHIRKLGYRIVVTSLGDDIGLLGAAALVWAHAEGSP